MRSWIFRNRARLAAIYGRRSGAREPASAGRPEPTRGLLIPRPRRSSCAR